MAKAPAADRKKNATAKGGKRAAGRPASYRPEYAALAEKFCRLGATNADLARNFEVAVSTIDKWISEIPAFSGAVKEGREIADAKVADSLFRRATGYSHPAVKINLFEGAAVVTDYTEHYPPDAASMIFWLKNRRPDLWREKIEHQHNASDEMLAALEAAGERARKSRGGT